MPPLDNGRADEHRYRYTGPGGSGATLGNRTQQQRLLAGAVQSTDAYALGSNGSLVRESGSFVGQVGSDDRLTLTGSTSAQSGATAWCDGYDAAGNLVSAGPGLPLTTPAAACAAPLPGPCFGHDDWGRVVVAGQTQPDGSCQALWWYYYDYKGRRVAAKGVAPQFASGWHVFHYDQGDRLIREQVLDDQGALTESTNYSYLGGELLAMARTQPTAAVHYFHNDHLGTPQRISQADGTVKWAARYSPFGDIGAGDLNAAVDCQEPLLENPHRFPGQYDDRRAGLGYYYYNYHRYYDPGTGTYTQADPMGQRGMNAGQHPYAYVGSNPLTRIDRMGLKYVYADPAVQELLTEFANHPLLGPAIMEMAGDQYSIKLYWENAKSLCSNGGGRTSGANKDAQIEYNQCVFNLAMRDTFGIYGDLRTVVAHELGHAWGCVWAGRCNQGDPESNRIALQWENSVRSGPPRPDHREGNRCLDCSSCQ
jgi:RHS repeat-associated protein